MAPSATQDHTYQAHAARHLSRHERDRLTPSTSATYATAAGNPVPQHHPYAAQRAGENGPLLLQQDFHHLELLQHFDRERVPERVVHAKGGGAHGYFECADPAASDVTAASLFAEAGKRCPVTVRFSTVGGESGSHDCARDPRGFSVKFRTDEGIWDIVANNTPVFFLRDPVKFPHFIHTQKRDPKTHLTHADDATHFWEYLSQNPESVHQVMILMGDRGIPDGWRFMHGYYGHSVKLIDAGGKWVYCQLHLKSLQGTKFLTQDEAAACGPDYAQRDLYEAIERGDFPRWSLEAQTMTPAEAERAWEEQGINVLDLTHVWPQARYPRRKLGEIALDQNVENYFAEVEQAAFNPAHMPPGIQPSADPILQSRLFSYSDTHCHRLGVNHKQLPVNSPSPAATNNDTIGNFQRDGNMALFNQGSRPNYLSSTDPITLPSRPAADLDRVHAHFLSDAVTFLSAIRPEDFLAPRALWQKVWDEPARERFVQNVAHKFGCCPVEEPLRRQIAIFREVDPDMAARVEEATGIKGYAGIADMQFNGTYNCMAKDEGKRSAGGFTKAAGYQGAPKRGTHEAIGAAMNGH